MAAHRRAAAGAYRDHAFPRGWTEFLAQYEMFPSIGNIPVTFRLRGALDPAAFRRAWRRVVERHEILRAVLVGGAKPKLRVYDEPLEDIDYVDISQASDGDARRRVREVEGQPIDIRECPPVKLTLLKLGPDDHVLVRVAHHMLVDLYSAGVIYADLERCYTAELGKAEAPAERPRPIDEWLIAHDEASSDDAVNKAADFWTRVLDGATEDVGLTTDRLEREEDAPERVSLPLVLLDRAGVEKLAKAAKAAGSSRVKFVFAAFAAWLARMTGNDDLLMRTAASSRLREDAAVVSNFATALWLRAPVAESESVVELAAKVGKALAESLEHRHVPMSVALARARARGAVALPGEPRVFFSYARNQLQSEELTQAMFGAPYDWTSTWAGFQIAPFAEFPNHVGGRDLLLMAFDLDGEFVAHWQYDASLFDRKTIEAFGASFAHFLESVATTPEAPIAHLSMTPDHAVPSFEPPIGTPGESVAWREPVHDTIIKAARSRLDGVAVACGETRYTWSEVLEQSERIAKALMLRGVGIESRVAIEMPRSAEIVVAILGTLRAGAAYVPIDPGYPDDRREQMLEDAECCLRIVSGAQAEASGVAAVDFAELVSGGVGAEIALPDVDPRCLAYVIFTSGSTGRPKGVLVQHETLAVSTWARYRYYESLDPGAVPVAAFLQLWSFAFDGSVLGLFAAWMCGGKVVVPIDGLHDDLAHLYDCIRREGVTHMLATPSFYRQIVQHADAADVRSLRVVTVGGEHCPEAVPMLHRRVVPNACLSNEYGPTEITIWSAGRRIDKLAPNEFVTLGRPCTGYAHYVLDSNMRPLPPGSTGELYIGGIGVTRGYSCAPSLTASRFLPDPFSRSPGARMYKTGDRVRRGHDGDCRFLGRADDQVKVRGYRVELAEVERALETLPAVAHAAAGTQTDKSGTSNVLIAYVVSANGGPLSLSDVRSELASRLPRYMMPDRVITVAELPRAASGKLDRKRLARENPIHVDTTSEKKRAPKRDAAQPTAAPATKFESSLESRLAAIWREVFAIEEIGLDQDFFELGGHSLTAVQLAARARETGINFSPRDVFGAPTVRRLAAFLRQDEPGHAPTPTGEPLESRAVSSLRAIWSDVLELDDVQSDADFFELGGHSLTAVQISARAREAGLQFSPRDIFANPTIARLAAFLGEPVLDRIESATGDVRSHADDAQISALAASPTSPADLEQIVRSVLRWLEHRGGVAPGEVGDEGLAQSLLRAISGSASQPTTESVAARAQPPDFADHLPPHISADTVQDFYALTPIQEAMYFYALSDASAYFVQVRVLLEGELDVAAYERAWQLAVDRHDILRTGFVPEGRDGPSQFVLRHGKLPFAYHDWSSLDESERASRFAALLESGRASGVSLEAPPLMSVAVIRLGDDVHRMVWSFHHLLADMWTCKLIFSDVFEAYEGFRRGAAPTMPKPAQFGAFVRWLATYDPGAAEAYFKNVLAGFERPLELTIMRPLPEGTPDRETRARASAEIDDALYARLQQFCREHRLTVNTVIQAAWALTLRTYGRTDDVIIGIVVAGRPPGVDRIEEMAGPFVNSLPKRFQFDDSAIVLDWLRGLQMDQLEMLSHELTPLTQIRRWAGLGPGDQLFPTILSFDSWRFDIGAAGKSNLHVTAEELLEHTNYPINVVALPGERLRLSMNFDARRFEAADVERMRAVWEHVIGEIVRHASDSIATIVTTTPDDTERLLHQHHPEPTAGSDRSILAEVGARVQSDPDRVAVSDDSGSLTYRELWSRAARVAHVLSSRSVRHEELLMLVAERSTGFLAAMLGIWRSGTSYTPVDPSYPTERIAQVLGETKARFILVDSRTREHVENAVRGAANAPELINLDELPAYDGPLEERDVLPRSLAYVIYTSGSTGVPKGAMVEHRGMVNHLHAKIDELGLAHDDVVAQTASQSFDISIWQFLAGLVVGARTEVFGRELVIDPTRLLDAVQARRVTVLETVPSLLQLIVDEIDASPDRKLELRFMIPTGEALTPELARRWHRSMPSVPLVNAYGPTECSDDVTHHVISDGLAPNQKSVPIGKALRNTRIYVVDDRMALVPTGVPGEIVVGGIGVGRGYYNRAKLTAQAFVPDPFSSTGARLYRTGDLGRWCADGTLEFLGRVDHQVKIRGNRVELGEVEARIAEVDGVREQVVIVRQHGGATQLIAYVVPVQGASLAGEQVRDALRVVVPDYMVPSIVVVMDALPLTPNGKVDRKALPEPTVAVAATAPDRGADGPPVGEVEAALARIWGDVLGVSDVGRHANFYELGGDSILMLRVVARARAVGMRISVAEAAGAQSLAEMAKAARVAETSDIEREGRPTGELPLLPIQSWFLRTQREHADHFNMAAIYEVRGIDLANLESAVATVADRHDALRLSFKREDSGGALRGTYRDRPGVVVDVCDLSAVAEKSRGEHTKAFIAKAQAGLNLVDGPLLRIGRITAGGAEPDRLLVVGHHLVFDGLSLELLADDLAAELAAPGAQAKSHMGSSSFASWANAVAKLGRDPQIVREASEAWKGVPWRESSISIAVDAQPGRVRDLHHVEVTADDRVTKDLLQIVRNRPRVKIQDLLIVALVRALERVGLPPVLHLELEHHGRDLEGVDVDVSATIGWFAVLAPYFVDLRESVDAMAAVRAWREAFLATPRSGAAYGMLRHGTAVSTGSTHDVVMDIPQAPVSFNFMGVVGKAPGSEPDSGFVRVPTRVAGGRALDGLAMHGLEINAVIEDDRVTLDWHSDDRVDPSLVSDWANAVIDQLDDLAVELGDSTDTEVILADFPLARLERSALAELRQRLGDIDDILPAVPLQHGLVVESLRSDGLYFNQVLFELKGDLDIRRLREAWRMVVQRHAALRTVFPTQISGLRDLHQVVRAKSDARVSARDMSRLDPEVREQEIERLLEAERARGFSFETGPLASLVAVRTGASENLLVVQYHHAVLDGWSAPIVVQDLFAAYRALVENVDPRFEARPPYSAFVRWLAEQDDKATRAFWEQQIGSRKRTPSLSRDAVHSAPEAKAPARRVVELPKELTQRLELFARQSHVTVMSLLQSSWAATMADAADAPEVTFGVVVSGRPADLSGAADIVGLFVNTLVLRARVDREMSVRDFLRREHARQVEMRANEAVSLAEVHRLAGCAPDEQLFDVLFVSEDFPIGDQTLEPVAGLELKFQRAVERTGYPLTIEVVRGESIRLELAYLTDAFDDATIDALGARWVEVLTRFADGAGTVGDVLSGMPALPEVPSWRLQGAATGRAPLFGAGLHDELSRGVQAHAFLSGSSAAVSRRAFAERVRHVASALLSSDVRAHDVVCVSGLGPLDSVAAVLGVTHVGAVAVLCDCRRSAKPCRAARSSARLPVSIGFGRNGGSSTASAQASPHRHVVVDTDRSPSNATLNGQLTLDAARPALIMPGVDDGDIVLSADALQQHIEGMAAALELQAGEVIEIGARPVGAGPLCVALASIAAGAAVRWDAEDTGSAVGATGIDSRPSAVKFATRYQLAAALSEGLDLPDGVRVLVVDDGPLPVGLARRFLAQQPCTRLATALSVSNVGPVAIGYWEPNTCEPARRAPLRSLSDTFRLDVMSARAPERSVSPGAPGRLRLRFASAGQGPAAGVRAEQRGSARSIVTAHAARRNATGALEWLGNAQEQHGVDGATFTAGQLTEALYFRDDVAVAIAIVGVTEAARAVVEVFVQPSRAGAELPVHELEPLIPRVASGVRVNPTVTVVTKLPLNRRGEVDASALAELSDVESDSADTDDTDDAGSDLTLAVREAWADALGSVAGPDDDLYALGGTSITAVRIAMRLSKDLGYRVPVATVLGNASIAQLTAALGGRRKPKPKSREEKKARLADDSSASLARTIPRVEREASDYPLTFGQESLFLSQERIVNSTALNIVHAVRVAGSLDPDVLSLALADVARRHEALRTNFGRVAGNVRQIPKSAWSGQLVRHDIRHAADRSAALDAFLERLVATQFRLDSDPLIVAHLVREGDDQYVFAFCAHHLVFDGWSMALFYRDVARAYEARARRAAPEWSDPAAQPIDFAVWQRAHVEAADMSDAREHWQKVLADANPTVELPADASTSADKGSGSAKLEFELSSDDVPALQGAARTHAVSPIAVLLAAFTVTLARYANQRDVLMGAPTAGREFDELNDCIGYFVVVAPLRLDLREARSFGEICARARGALIDAQIHQSLPLPEMFKAAGITVAHRDKPFQIGFSATEKPDQRFSLGGHAVQPVGLPAPGGVHFDFAIELLLDKSSVQGAFFYRDDLFAHDFVQQFSDHFVRLLRACLQNGDSDPFALPILSESEQSALCSEIGQGPRVAEGGVDFSEIARCVREVASASPARIAVSDKTGEWTFAELWSRAGQIAATLKQHGVKRESLVAVVMKRSRSFLAAMLGIWRAGAVYVPVDPRHPAARLAEVMRESGAIHVLADAAHSDHVSEAGALLGSSLTVVTAESCSREPIDDDVPAHARQLAYVIYTSGSTGVPKGAMVEQKGMLNHLRAKVETLAITSDDIVAQTASQSFDISVWQFVSALLVGGRVDVIDDEVALDPRALLEHVRASGISVLETVPSLMQLLVDRAKQTLIALPRLRWLIPTGETLGPDLARQWHELYPSIPVVNAYGPTECSDDVTHHVLADGVSPAETRIPIGEPLRNTRIYVVDDRLALTPAGVVGEVCIAGDGVGRGYLRRPNLTAQVFVPDPFGPPGSRMYRSGDFARWRPDGTLDFIGRIDEQVKIRGYRVELDEISEVLRTHAAVVDAVAIVVGAKGADERVVAYVVLSDPAESVIEALRALARERLAWYMVPRQFVVLERMPLNVSGKIDRKALPEAPAHVSAEPPRTNWERRIAEAWAAVLQVPEVGRDVDFFELGGNSISAVQILNRIRTNHGVDLELADLFNHSVVSELAQLAEKAGAEGEGKPALPPLTRVERTGAPLATSYAQERMFFLQRLDPTSSAYNVPLVLRASGLLDRVRLAAAVRAVVQRHETLRTRYQLIDASVLQVVDDEWMGEVELVDQRDHPSSHDAHALRELIEDVLSRPFDLEREHPLRVMLCELGAEDSLLVVNVHHIATDGWSNYNLLRDLSQAFGASEPSAALQPLDVQYADFSVWQRLPQVRETLDAAVAFWAGELREAPRTLDLPTDFVRPDMQQWKGAQIEFEIDAELTKALQVFVRAQRTTLFNVLLTAYSYLLSVRARTETVVVGTTVAARQQRVLEPIVGFFVNTLALPVRVGEHAKLSELHASVRSFMLDALHFQEAPFARVVEELAPERDMARSPIFQANFEVLNAPKSDLEFGDVPVRRFGLGSAAAKFDIELSVMETGDTIQGQLVYDEALFASASMQSLSREFVRILQQWTAAPELAYGDVALLSPGERARVLSEYNDTAADNGSGSALDRIRARVEAHPDAVAVVDERGEWTARTLWESSSRIGAAVQARGLATDDLVAIAAERSREVLAAMLGAWRAGCAYVPIDPRYPAERIRQVLTESRARVVLCSDNTEALIREAAALLDAPPTVLRMSEILVSRDDVRDVAVRPRQLAYVIFTSGSTGTPKGAMVEQRGMINHLIAKIEEIGISDNDVIAQTASQSFDVSVWQFVAGLLVGARVEVFADDTVLEPSRLMQRADERGVTIMQSVPSLLQVIVDDLERGGTLPRALRCTALTGEALTPELARRWHAIAPGVPLLNSYGPTECADGVTHAMISDRVPDRECRTSIGRPVRNMSIYLLDNQLRPVPNGVVGEVYAAGPGVGRGYYGRPSLTAMAFVPNPFVSTGERMYRMGDLARRRADGTLEFVGRVDHQVKVRGNRVELGEIEARLAELDIVRDQVVTLPTSGVAAGALVAYVVPARGVQIDASAVQEALGRRLPDYMVPTFVEILEALPLLPNGKANRKALPEPTISRSSADAELPETETEELVARLWREVLSLEQVGRRDHFFRLGGHSLAAMRVVGGIRSAVGVDVPIRIVFDKPVLSELAQWVEQRPAEVERAAGVTPRRPGERVPLTPAQQRFWLHQKYDPTSVAYNIAGVLDFEPSGDAHALATAVSDTVAHQEILRTRFRLRDGVPEQVVESHADVTVPEVDCSNDESADESLQKIARDLASTPFDLESEFPWRAAVVRGRERLCLVLVVHHIASDAHGNGVLVREIRERYAARLETRNPAAPTAPISYADYAVWLNRALSSDRLATHLAFFRNSLAGAPQRLELVNDFSRPESSESPAARVSVELSSVLPKQVDQFASHHGLSAFGVYLAAFGEVLARAARQRDMIIGVPISGRDTAELEHVVGVFANTLPVRVDLRGEPKVLDALERVGNALHATLEHGVTPFSLVASELATERDLSSPPLYQVLLSYVDASAAGQVTTASSPVRESDIEFEAPIEIDLAVTITRFSDRTLIEASYKRDVFDAVAIKQICQRLITCAERIVGSPDRRISSLDLLLSGERERLQTKLNATERDFPSRRSLAAIAADVVRRDPDAIAVVDGARRLTARDVDQASNAVAHWLVDSGVGRGDRVGIRLGRGVDYVVAVLGVVKSGAAYVPIDPAYPSDRTRLIVQAAEPVAFICPAEDSAIEELQAQHSFAMLHVDDKERMRRLPTSAVSCQVGPDDLAYIMFTSGTTGVPKGVAVSHRAVARFACSGAPIDIRSTDVMPSIASPGGDGSVFDVWGALLNGARLAVVHDEDVASPLTLRRAFREYGVTLCAIPTALFIEASRIAPDILRGMRWSIVFGERFDVAAAERVFAAGGPDILYNGYGPTEGGVGATVHQVTPASERRARVPIGAPLANTRVFVVDASGQLAATGMPGEICVGGPGLAMGYWRRPAATATVFVPDPFGPNPGERIYRTGDIGRILTSGQVEFLGRGDDQVKLRGYRVELSEIDQAMEATSAGTRACAFIQREPSGDEFIVAALLPAPGVEVDTAKLRERLKAVLPAYMVPVAFGIVDEFPLNAHGKVDRGRLPRFQREADTAVAPQEEPSGSVEEMIARQWCEVLNRDAVGANADFFALGGHSLLGARLVGILSDRMGLEVPLRTLFAHPTLRAFAAQVERIVDGQMVAGGASADEVTVARPSTLEEAAAVGLLEEISGERALAVNVDPAQLELSADAKARLLERSKRELGVEWVVAPAPERSMTPHDVARRSAERSRTAKDLPQVLAIAPLGGTGTAYQALSRALFGRATLVALDFPGLKGGQPLASVGELADFHIRELSRRGDPAGSVVLGYSLGAIVAHEVSRRLAESGRAPRATILVDGRTPELEVAELADDEDRELERLAWLLNRRFALGEGLETVLKTSVQAIKAHRLTFAPIDAALVVSGQNDEDGDLGWSPFVKHVSRILVPGSHASLIEFPNVAQLADIVLQNTDGGDR